MNIENFNKTVFGCTTVVAAPMLVGALMTNNTIITHIAVTMGVVNYAMMVEGLVGYMKKKRNKKKEA